MKQFIQECDGVAGLCNVDLAKIPIYENLDCINAAITAGCLTEGQLVANPACADPVPLVGTADTVFIRTPVSGYVSLVSNVGGSYGCIISTPMTYVCATDTLNVTNLTATGCINGVCYSCYAQLCDIPSLSGYATTTDVSTAESNACGYTDIRETCIMDSVSTCTGCACAYACEIAERCGKCYFEDCIQCCFDDMIATWWADHKGEVETAAQTDNNRLWVI